MSTRPPGGKFARKVTFRSGYCAAQGSAASAKSAKTTTRTMGPPQLDARFLVVEVFLDMVQHLVADLVLAPQANQLLPLGLHRRVPQTPRGAGPRRPPHPNLRARGRELLAP